MIDGIGRGQLPRLLAQGMEATPRGPMAVEPAATGPRPATKAPAGAVVRAMAASPPVDSARVEVLRNAIAAGTYKPDPAAIAARMIALESGGGR
ncbi:flagellar biosynthesis anti-sigma factor FlgM [Polymorphobacter fuscus]|uniref:Negative regulator of flagellin synthesis n=1 Tax=Sandarakinorhabdus fusca TaxID=1439888 RepID=A0A7C9KGK0_9SPHN|nr:flagellar biosynthesis anti-sigma factor FlgM [Polymorphobacter fuscus]KAB7648235.1 flagellar biosynthesis anti-sigma factor FlgM [Polymorphobacter fuscus]MQT15741.1 flagellar biosynthesis anti-sigma factor FlgM [Polymorphobacter fuscus]NJC07988.1 flagellar biosynthesis anti-sigma factor FlgM [Polymorphobacter fuscus]